MYMKTFDCFTFFNEQDILQIRLEEMGDLVDQFIIVESSKTFTGKNKPFYLDHVPSWINRWKDKILNVRIDFPNNEMSSWEREHYQRNQILRGLETLGVAEDDRVIISDADEIIKSSFLLKNITPIDPVKLDVTQYFWNFNWVVPQHCNQGSRPVMCLYKHLKERSPQELRSANLQTILDCGWHFSFFGELEKIKTKIESFAHTEYDVEKYKSAEKTLQRIELGIDPFDRFPLKYFEIDESLPKFIFSKYAQN